MLFKDQKKINYSDYYVLTEILFIIIPIIVLAIIEASKGSILSIFDKGDISFCSVLLCGQLIIKLVSTLLKKTKKVHWQFVAFELALLICIGLIPSLLFYVLMQGTNVRLWVKISQVIWLFVLIFVYFELGGYAQEKDDCEDGEN